jgi:two-component system chemotaxis response regulator CheB
MNPIRILVVDDSVVMRRVICQILEGDPELEIAGWAANGRLALERIPQVNPDCVTLDVEMPEMDGIAALREIRKGFPRLPVIMFSTETRHGAVRTIEALSLGATDYVSKPANVGSVNESVARLREELVPRIKAHCSRPLITPAAQATSRSPVAASSKAGPPASSPYPVPRHCDIICVASSTGGPNALSSIFQHLRAALPVPVVLVQHMPPMFTALLAERLDSLGGCRVSEARDGEVIRSGHAYIAPGGRHMEVMRAPHGTTLKLTDAPPENSCRPAADVLFRSVAPIYGPRALGLVLTGMGQDGMRGSRAIVERGGVVMAQDESSSVVWGMPGSVVQHGLAERILGLAGIPDALQDWVRRYAPSAAAERVAS